MGDGADDALDYIEDCWEYNQQNPDDPDNDPLAGWWGDVDELASDEEEEEEMMLEIEEGCGSDVFWVAAIDRMCFGSEAAWRPKDFREEMAIRGVHLAVIRERAYILYRKWGRWFDIIGIAVHPRCRHRGLGRRLMEHVIEQSRRFYGPYVLLEVNCTNEKAIRLYEDLGFVVIDRLEDYYGEDDHAYRMMLDE